MAAKAARVGVDPKLILGSDDPFDRLALVMVVERADKSAVREMKALANEIANEVAKRIQLK